MNTLLLVGWLALPLAPLNPLEQDTLPNISMHFTAGLSGPNGIVSLGPEVSAKYELLIVHPFVMRGAVDFKYGWTVSDLYPRGDLYTMTLSADALYYRGTSHMTGYIGLGAVYSFHHFHTAQSAADSLFANERVFDVDVSQKWGYRITLGLRFRTSYSLEVGITEIRPDFIKHKAEGHDRTSRSLREMRTGSIRVTVGYLLPIKKF